MFILQSKPLLGQAVKEALTRWNFPTRISHLDDLGHKLIATSPDFDSVQYKDQIFRQRRFTIGEMAKEHRLGSPIRQVPYSEVEHETWRTTLKKLNHYQRGVMSRAYLQNMAELESTFNFSAAIPKMNALSDYLRNKTGFRLKPAGGMQDQRQFLNCLAFGVFCAGQFIRHPQSIDNAPEPDLIHDFVGHIPMFADPQIAALSQEIGLLSLGASDEDIQRLGYAYIYTVQLGFCVEDGRQRAFGAAIASCASELKKISAGNYKWKEFEPETDCQIIIEDFQQPFERFYVCKSINLALQGLLQIGKSIKKPFKCKYNQKKEEIQVHQN